MFVTFLCSKKITRRNLSKSYSLFQELTNSVTPLLQLLASAALLLFVSVHVGVLVLCQSCDMSYCGKC